MSVISKFKDGLSPEEFAELETSINAVIEEKARERADLIVEVAKKELEELAEEFTAKKVEQLVSEKTAELEESFKVRAEKFKESAIEKLDEMAESYVAEEVEKRVEALKVTLEEGYADKIQILEDNVVATLDKFLELEVSEKISDALLESIAINETYAPIVAGIRDLFETKFVALDVDGKSVIKEAEEKASALKTRLSESTDKNLALIAEMDKLKLENLVLKETASLTESQKSRVSIMLEGKSFADASSKISTIMEIVSEKEEPVVVEDEVVNDDVSGTVILESEEEPAAKKSVDDKYSAVLSLLG
jgi:hypothetical protein